MDAHTDKEINILGGGISGLACAIILRENGYNVNVYEKKSSIGSRFNCDWQGIENWSEKNDVLEEIKSFGIDLSFEHVPICELDLHYSNKVCTLRGKNACYAVKRGNASDCLDISLFKQAHDLGVNVHFSEELKKNDLMHVIATGPRKGNIFAKGIKFTTNCENSYHLALGRDIAKGFYSYLLIQNGHGTIATVFDKKEVSESENFLQKTIDYFSQYLNEKDLNSGKKFGGYGNFEIRESLCTENGALLIGEAGGLQDYFWGFGMRYAFQSANFAARSIMSGESYDDLVKKNLHKKMKHSKRNRYAFEMMGPLAYPLAYYLFDQSKEPLELLNRIYR